jgi:hypothetical protein
MTTEFTAAAAGERSRILLPSKHNRNWHDRWFLTGGNVKSTSNLDEILLPHDAIEVLQKFR